MNLLYCLLFGSGVATDVVWALYIRHTSVEHKTKLDRRIAATYSVATGVFGVIAIEGVLQGGWFGTGLWLCGLWIGTYWADPIEQLFRRGDAC